MRVAMITRRFWPLVGGAEMAMANLASAFRDQGHEVRLVTARWEPCWPAEIRHRDIPVVRLTQPRTRGWGTLRYLRALTRWLIDHREEFDLAFVSMLKHDAYAAVSSRKHHHLPIVIRAEGGGATGDCRWHQEGRFGMSIRRMTWNADGFIAPSLAVASEMLAAGYDPRRTQVIENGVPILDRKQNLDRERARAALAELHPALVAADHEHLAIYTGRLHAGKGLLELVAAWPKVLNRYPHARLWLVGEGEFERTLRNAIRDLDLQDHVILPGAFDDVSDLLVAADLFVLPSHEEGLSLSLLEAMAAELPCVVSDIPGNRQVVSDGVQGVMVPIKSPERLASAILQLFADEPKRLALGQAARQVVSQRYSMARMAQSHLDLFTRVIADRGVR